jgi:hypothetical protein
MYQISSTFSYAFKYILPYVFLILLGIGFYKSINEAEIILTFFCGFGIVYISLITVFVINKISVFVYVDRNNKIILACNDPDGKMKSGRWDELISVQKFLNFYTVLKFRNGLKIRFRPKRYIMLLEQDDAGDIIDLLRQLALRNKVRVEFLIL